MKHLIYLFSLFAALMVVSTSCSPDEEKFYEGEPYLFFNKGEKQSVLILQGSNHRDVPISVGTLKPVSGSHQVKLVVDKAKSTAVEGVDFQLPNNGVFTITEGQVSADGIVRVLESGATTTPKIAVFKIQSSTIGNATFKQEFALSMSLTCPVSYFVGNGIFKNTEAYWMAPAGQNYTVVDAGIAADGSHQLKIKQFWDDGSDVLLTYDPETFEVHVPIQPTGYQQSATQFAYAMDANNGAKSSFNPCTRVMTLNIFYHTRNAAGTTINGQYGNGTEVFVGQ